MRRALAPVAAAVLLAACGGPTEEEQNLDTRGEHPAVVADPAPGQPELGEGPVTPGERGSIYNAQDNQNALSPGNEAAPQPDVATASPDAEAAVAVVRQFGDLLEQRQFAEARALYGNDGEASGVSADEFADRFENFETIDSAVAYAGRVEGAAGSLYTDVQLTLTGNLDSGEPYSRTGLVTLRRVNNVPGATEEQLRWHIVKVRLGQTAPGAADAI